MLIEPSFIGKKRKVCIPLPRSSKEDYTKVFEVEVIKTKINVEWMPFGVHLYSAKDLNGYDGIMMNKSCGKSYRLWDWYRIKTPSIFIREKLFETPERLKWVLLHEIGHHLLRTKEATSFVDSQKIEGASAIVSKTYKERENEATRAGKLWGYLFLAGREERGEEHDE